MKLLVILYADDTIILSDNENDFQQMLNLFNDYCNSWKLKINSTETKIMIFGDPYGENLIAPCSQVHENFTMGVNRKILINLMYLFIQETYLTCANGLSSFIIYPL